jgi:glutathione synthase/RimK-type ligase-like ATP-grasp enzyme
LRPQIAFVTSRRRREPTEDDALAAVALAERGARVIGVPWDEPGVDWRAFDLVLLRSCWDYHQRPAEFLAWTLSLERAAVNLWNPPALVRWNADKRYLLELATKGANVAPTEYVSRAMSLAAILSQRGWHEAVVKPAVSASAWRTWRTSARTADRDQQHLDEVLAGGTALVQEFVPEVERYGEWSLVFLDGWFSHAALKVPAPGDFRVQEELGGSVRVVGVPEGLVAAAAATLRMVGETTYARVDGVGRPSGFQLMELELIEPCLFFATDRAAPGRMADAIFRRLRLTAAASD